jgi:hypothetical protein
VFDADFATAGADWHAGITNPVHCRIGIELDVRLLR